ncbi:MAG: hypothetical protein DME26_05790 [Verrucomicrobia bacterium]|nr:MAG: hypothetical protein DME26_05790 [Verrucomicrobiota bacterium]
MKPKLSDLWRWDGTVERGIYLFWGVLLLAIKINVDRWLSAVLFGKCWTIFDWEYVRLYLWQSAPTKTDQPYYLALLAASLPFLWAGTVLTLRRLRSLGWKPWLVIIFFVPLLKLIFFTVLCLLPSRTESTRSTAALKPRSNIIGAIIPQNTFGSALVAIGISTLVALVAVWLGTSVLRNYGWSIFVSLPFSMGFLSALLHTFHKRRSLGTCLWTANATVLLAGAGLLLFAMEGAICLVMAAPLACAIGSAGGAAGYAIQETLWRREAVSRLFCLAILMVPAAMGLEHAVPPPLPLLEVTSSVVVRASPEKVWRNVVSFAELPPPHELLFKLGVAYPIRAEIYGQGVGAVRHCRFSTGPFVEPIEVWEEPRLLRFSVTKNPEPMQEWTPYHRVHPAHLDGYLESRAGQFRLVPRDGGRTLLEGTTWYHHHMWPAAYWQLWSDHIIHTIHVRVLNHVKKLSEGDKP